MALETDVAPAAPTRSPFPHGCESDADAEFPRRRLTVGLRGRRLRRTPAVRQRRTARWQSGSRAAEPEAALERAALHARRGRRPLRVSASVPQRSAPRAEVGRSAATAPAPAASPRSTHALLKAVCGQLIQRPGGRLLEAKLSASLQEHEGCGCPTDSRHVRELRAGRSAADWIGQPGQATSARPALPRARPGAPARGPDRSARARIERERGLGPWSAGVICLYGLGRFEHGLVGDLGLIKLCAALKGRRADEDDTRELLEPYGEWAGLASLTSWLRAGPGRTMSRPYM